MIRMKRYTGLASGPVALFDSLSEPFKKRKEMRHWGAHRSRSDSILSTHMQLSIKSDQTQRKKS